ncbi:MAG: FAD-binding oxidoreductase [bacterium]
MPEPDSDGAPSPDGWGFADSGFAITDDGKVTMTGSRYPLSGKVLPHLIPWISGILGIDVDPFDRNEPHYPPQVPEPVQNRKFLKALGDIIPESRQSDDDETRLRRGHGHTQEDIWAIRYGSIPRVPDLVVWPETDEEVEALVQCALTHDVTLIPYGGGSNVSEALRCDRGEKRMIISVDLGRMNRILWVDPENHTACIQAGAYGRHIHTALKAHGYTMGHEPDSVEFSTLGGWIATNASGMKKNRYGNIEDIVRDVTAITVDGKLQRYSVGPRESIGLNPRNLLFGSEGNIAIITSAIVSIFPVPEVRAFDSVLLHTFEDGVAMTEELMRQGNIPASVRLVDNMQFQFSQALKPATTGRVAKLKSRMQKFMVTKLYGYEPDAMCVLTLVYEGSAREVADQQKRVKKLARKYRGLAAGAENGQRGYTMTFAIAYIRDFVMKHWVIAESFETSVPWSNVVELCDRVKQRVVDEHAARKLPGRPYVTCRVTQLYPTGVCVYFYLAFHYKGVDHPSEVFSEIERAARDEILKCGGSLSHHHGIGKIREQFVDRIHSSAGRSAVQKVVHALDPTGVFGAGNHGARSLKG